MRIYFSILGVLLTISSLFAQPANSFEGFIQKGKSGEFTYAEIDSTVVIDFFNKEIDFKYYLELSRINEKEFFYLEENATANDNYKMLCKCSIDKLDSLLNDRQNYFSDLLSGVWSFSKSINVDVSCIYDDLPNLNIAKGEKVNFLLSEKAYQEKIIAAQDIQVIDASITSSIVQSDAGNWIIFMKGQLPEGYTFLNWKESESVLQYLKDEKSIYHYPKSFIPNWQANLIKQGVFSGVGFLENQPFIDPHLDWFYPMKKNDDSKWEMAFVLKKEDQTIAPSLFAKGYLTANAYTEEDDLIVEPIGFSLDGEYQVILDEKERIKIIKPNNEKSNLFYAFNEWQDNWEKCTVRDDVGNVVTTIEKGKVHIPKTYTFSNERAYFAEFKAKKVVPLKIPFDIKLDIPQEDSKENELESEMPRLKSVMIFKVNPYNDYDRGIMIQYEQHLPEGMKLKEAKVTTLRDNTGKDLLKNHPILFDQINQKIKDNTLEGEEPDLIPSSLRNVKLSIRNNPWRKENYYALRLKTFDFTDSKATEIILEAALIYQDSNLNEKEILWKDTISLTRDAEQPAFLAKKVSAKELSVSRQIPMNVILTYNDPITEQALFAIFNYPENPDNRLKYLAIDPHKSKIVSLTDESGADLELLDQIAYKDRLKEHKRNLDVLEKEEIYPKKRSLLESGEKNGQFYIFFTTDGLPQKGSGRIYGHSALSILGYYPDRINTYKTSFNLDKQTVFDAGDVLFQYTQLSLGATMAEGGFATHFKLTDRSKPKEEYAILDIRVKNSKGEQINYSSDEIKDKNFNSHRDFALPRTLEDENFTIEIDYVKLHSVIEDFYFEVGLGIQ